MNITVGVVKAGEAVWRAIAPYRRIKTAINKRRARKGKPLLPITPEDDKMFPKGTMTYSGAVVVFVGLVLRLLGIGDCAPEDLSCVSNEEVTARLTQAIDSIVQLVGLVIVVLGRLRVGRA